MSDSSVPFSKSGLSETEVRKVWTLSIPIEDGDINTAQEQLVIALDKKRLEQENEYGLRAVIENQSHSVSFIPMHGAYLSAVVTVRLEYFISEEATINKFSNLGAEKFPLS